MEEVVIIGHGPAGLTAAVYASRAGLRPLVLASSSELGQLEQTTEVENFPGFPEGIMGPKIVENIREQAFRFGARFEVGHVLEIRSETSPFTLVLQDGRQIQTRTVILATGAKPRRLGLESETRFWGYGVTACAVCDGFFYRNRAVAVIGGGDSACEEALYLAKIASKVTLIHRRDTLRASKVMAKKVLEDPNIEVLWNCAIDEVIGDESGVTGLGLLNTVDQTKTQIPVHGVFLAIGHIPNTESFKGAVDLDEEGYVKVEKGSTKTSRPGIFAAGDLQDKTYRQAITAAACGCMAALDAERWLAVQS